MIRWSFPAALALILASVAAAHWHTPGTAPGGTRTLARPASPDPGGAPAAPGPRGGVGR
ncbi:hypothetical protein Q8W71_13785 [Methylobacterium sp. NEAU 140]|uniref:hypothetical protein n=1 Tax=Methylobacterium sp. NEAU 140 TaxID=3064945 RepID=UPI002733DF53|nr:hypothetical protein [Methylobacterium sp. NEAU 140]MDP4023703.1 hypothetical protein [Methylobacterium sp. NEAU 140]